MTPSQITANSLPMHDPPSRPPWSSRRWSTLSNALVHSKKPLHSQRQKRKTFPPALRAHDHITQQLNPTSSFPGIFLYQQPSSDSPNQSHPSNKKIKRLLKKKPDLTIETNFTDSIDLQISELPPTISSDSIHTSARLPTPPSRFSAHFIDLDGHLGRVEYRSQPESSWLRDLFQYNLYPYNTPFLPIQRLTQEEFKRYSRRLWMDAILFLFGFLLFPLWWIGFGLFVYRKFKRPDSGLQFAVYHELYSIDTVGFLNGAFSLFSLVLVVVLMVWLF
ncbi:hypothetical protein EDC96DRAFT_253457 [Choanephora cucurbitarum]|nr:hypothetical protein EDC96DRAFT_253457 [Choanephora cucurbitarum]